MTELKHDGPAPYGPPQTVIDVIEGYRDKGYPTPFTPDVLLRAGVSEGLVNRVLQTLRLLGLIDEGGFPTEQMDLLKRVRGEEEFRERLQAWLRGVYAEVLKYTDPAVDPPDRVAEAFRGFTPEGQRNRMVTLMMGLFRYAGLIPDQALPRVPSVRTRSKPPSGAASRIIKQSPRQTPSGGPIRVGRVAASAAPAAAGDGLPPGLLGLLQQIPRNGEGWTANRRDEFLRAFEAVLNFSVPVERADPAHAALEMRSSV